MRGRRFFWCAFLVLAAFGRVALAQPDTFEGNPDTSAFIWIPRDTDDWTRHFRIGAIVGLNISADFSRSGTFAITGNNPDQGIFDDGYIRTDSSGNAFGYTSYWGYDNASQLNGSTLNMNAARSYSAAGNAEKSGVFPGFDMAYGGNLWYWKHARVGWEFGFDLLPISISDNESTSGSVTQFSYTFNTGGITPPTTPYQGGFNRNGGQPTIPYPSSFSPDATNILDGNITGKQTLDVMLYAFRLGPTFYWDLTDRLSLSLGGGPAVGLVSGNYKYDETITYTAGVNQVSAHNTGKIDGTDLIYGGYVNATLLCHVTDSGDIYAGVQYMPMSNATISGGGRSGRLNLGGQIYFTIGINWPF